MSKNTHIHILGIAGTFMAGIASIAKELGFIVTGQDSNIYPPMSDLLVQENINFTNGYIAEDMPDADLFVIGNALSRGNECVEFILNKNLNYTSGAQFLHDNVLKNKWVIAVSGTHGKTSTASMLVSILEYAKLNPSFLVGGKMLDFEVSARLTNDPFFVIEADEYDTAFFDKRSKFVHYKPNTLIINNLEFDHADIFDSLKDIQKQFHYLCRIVPQQGLIIYPQNDKNIDEVIKQGCWSETKKIPEIDLQKSQKGSCFEVVLDNKNHGLLDWHLLGEHNKNNAMAAILAAQNIGITPEISIEALNGFKGIKQRLEVIKKINNTIIYDDFAHHPTAIETTLDGLRKTTNDTIIVILELRSNTMKMGFHQQTLIDSLSKATQVFILNPQQQWLKGNEKIIILDSVTEIVQQISQMDVTQNNHIVIMSNGSFDGMNQKIITALE
jgi:UDP-N-acetylmuramate: L-alanyl-gamma-D-glutamyl-meso-diaminopimelate ligase